MKSADDLRIQRRFHREEGVAAKDLQPLYAVLISAGFELLNRGNIIFVQGNDQSAVLTVRNAKLSTQVRIQRGSADVVICFFRAGYGIISRMDKTAVRFRGAFRDVASAVKNRNGNIVTGNLPCDRAAGDPRTDDKDIGFKIHIFASCFIILPKKEVFCNEQNEDGREVRKAIVSCE